MTEEVHELVRRVVGRVMAERGLAGGPERAAGVHAAVEPAGLAARPAPAEGDQRPTYAAPSGSRQLLVAVGSDHGGFALKRDVLAWLGELGQRAVDLGTRDENAVDYPDYASAVAQAVAEGRADLGVCVDGAGIGSAMAANKVPGARAACCWDEASARNAREHNFANVLCLGGRVLGPLDAERILRTFLATPEGAARHERRVEKIAALEARYTRRVEPVRRVRGEVGS